MSSNRPELEHFGTTPSGETVHRVRLSGGGLTATVLTWGSVIQDLRLDGHTPPLVLGFDTPDDYLGHSPYFGATPGRCANRIASGRFTLDGEDHQLELNERGYGHLHGGSDGLAVRVWQVAELSEDRIVLTIEDPEGRAGYPGTCRVTATYALQPGGILSVTYESQTDRPTLANLCQHSYFNLDGRPDTLDHELMITADHYLPVDDRLIPSGEIKPVEGTSFDFRSPSPVRQFVDGEMVQFDHNFCLSPQRTDKRSVARLTSPHTDVVLEVLTTEPGVQFYAGAYVDVAVPGLEGRSYGPFSGICLETQIWPDAINNDNFPSAVLRPGETLRQETDYVFSRG